MKLSKRRRRGPWRIKEKGCEKGKRKEERREEEWQQWERKEEKRTEIRGEEEELDIKEKIGESGDNKIRRWAKRRYQCILLLPHLLILCFSFFLSFQCPTLDPSFTDETWSFLILFQTEINDILQAHTDMEVRYVFYSLDFSGIWPYFSPGALQEFTDI